MNLWVYFLAFFVLTTSEDGLETSSGGIDNSAKLEVEEVLSAVRNKIETLKSTIAHQDEEIKQLTRHMEYLKMAGPKLGVLDLMDGDDTLGEIASRKHSERFTHVTAVSLRVPKRERSNVPKRRLPQFQVKARRNAVHVIVTVNTDQQIKIWDMEQNELAMVETESSSKVTALLAATANQKAFLLAGFADGHVLVYTITAWRTFDEETNTLAVEGYINVFSNGVLEPWAPKKVEQKEEEVKNEEVKNEEEKGKEEVLDEVEEIGAAVSSLGLNNRKHAKQFMVGYDNGYIRMYRRDGRLRKEMHTGNSSVLAIGWETDRTSIPIFTDSGFRFCKTGLKMIGGFCPHKEGTQFTSYAFDVGLKNFLYVAYSDGRVVLFDAKKLSQKYLCVPKFEIEVESGSPLHLETTEGYLLASSPTTLYIFNTSDVSLTKHPFLVEKRAMSKDENAGVFGRMAATIDTYHHTLIVTTQLFTPESCVESETEDEGALNGSSMVVYESYMKPKEKEKKEKGWTAMISRTPILVIGFALVIFMQFSGKGSNPLAKIFSGRGKGGRGRRANRRSNRQQNNMLDMQRRQSYGGVPSMHMYEDS